MKPTLRRLATLALLVPTVAAAQSEPTAGVEASFPSDELVKNPALAGVLSLAATGAGLTLLAVSDDAPDAVVYAGLGLAIIGPSAGHIYAGEGGHALGMTALRAAAASTGLVAMLSRIDFCASPCPVREDHDGATALMVASGIVYAGATLYDLYDAPRAADRANRRAALQLAPTAIATRDGIAPGLVLGGRF